MHCAGGVDRTGLVTALLLRLAGVGHDDIAADFAESERNWAPLVPAWIEEAPDDEEREHRRYLSVCPPEVMLGVLEDIEGRGTVEEYLVGAGVTTEEIQRVRARLHG